MVWNKSHSKVPELMMQRSGSPKFGEVGSTRQKTVDTHAIHA